MNKLENYLIIINIITFLFYGIDKFLVKNRLTRIPEVVLFFFALIGGPLGALIGMKTFHHKTKKIKFYIFNIIMLIIYIYIIINIRGI